MRSIDMADVFQTLFAVAWADGELREQERNFLGDLVHRSEAGAQASAWFKQAPPEPDWQALRADDESASAVLRQAMYMAAADETIQYEETLLLDRLREQLGLSEDDFRRIQQEVEQAHA
jgi:tellurite resistance protein